MRPQPRTLAIVLTSVAFGLGMAGCGNPAPQAGPSQTASSGAPVSTAPRTSASAGHSTAVTPAGSDRCHEAELKADVQLQKDGSAMAILTNKGTRTCTVNGYLNFRGLLADNSAVAVPTKHQAHPGAPVPITLKRGTSAFSGVKWTSCDKADASCLVLAGLQVTPPEETTRLTATVLGTDGKALLQLTVSSAGFTAGSLQPASQGVVFP